MRWNLNQSSIFPRCLALDIQVSVAVSAKEAVAISKFVEDGGDLLEEVMAVDVERADTRFDADKDLIRTRIRKTTGFEQINELVHKALLQAYSAIAEGFAVLKGGDKNCR